MPKDDVATVAVRALLGDVEYRIESLERALAKGRREAELARAALASGNLAELVRTVSDNDLLTVAPALTLDDISALLDRGYTDGLADAVQGRLVCAVKRPEAEPGFAEELIRTVVRSRTWHADLRLKTLMAPAEGVPELWKATVSVAATDPHTAVLLGMRLRWLPGPNWLRSVPRDRLTSALERGAGGDHYRLGAAFRGGLSDPDLEADLVDLLATMEPVEVAARLAAQMPVVSRPFRPSEVAERLANLDMLVAAVARPTGT